MWYILFGYLGFLIICIILAEIFISKTKDAIKYHPYFGRTFYGLSLGAWIVGGFFPYIFSNQIVWQVLVVFASISLVILFVSFSLIVSYYKIENNSIVKRVWFIKKVIKYEDFVIVYKANVGTFSATSVKTGKDLFSFNMCHINTSSLIQDYSKFSETRGEINLGSKLVKANKLFVGFGLFMLFLGLAILALAIVFSVLDIFEEEFPLYVLIIFLILSFIVLGFSLFCWLIYFFNYLEIESDYIVIHRPFRRKKTYNSQNLYIEQNLVLLKIKDNNNKLVFTTLLNATQNLILLYKCLGKTINSINTNII